jgi:hypothetical protein
VVPGTVAETGCLPLSADVRKVEVLLIGTLERRIRKAAIGERLSSLDPFTVDPHAPYVVRCRERKRLRERVGGPVRVP